MAEPGRSTPAGIDLTDPVRFRSFYDAVLPRVYSYLLFRCGGNAPVAEDLTQTVFLAAVRELRSGRRIEHPNAWVMGIARHKLVDHYRSLEREERRLRLVWSADEPEPALDERLDREIVLKVLGDLPAAQRGALVLRYFDDLPVAEVALALGKSVHATESLLARGRAAFRRRYREAADD
jgi:RNA polymerase sigma-70 factor (ECF subfamily)